MVPKELYRHLKISIGVPRARVAKREFFDSYFLAGWIAKNVLVHHNLLRGFYAHPNRNYKRFFMINLSVVEVLAMKTIISNER